LILQEIYEEDQRRNKINGLKHDNLVYHVGTIADDPDYAFVTRYHARGSLYTDLVERRAKVNFSAKEIAKIALDVANAVHALHKADLVTRVVASRNVILDKDSTGIRARLDLNFEPSTAAFFYGRQHAYIGPISWLAPEAIESKKYNAESDSFSFGVFLWELVARADPFEERSSVGVACPLIHKGLRLKVPEDAPKVFKELITACFEEDPKSRPSSQDIQKELKGYYESL
jgi:serine/threonine protein kinase